MAEEKRDTLHDKLLAIIGIGEVKAKKLIDAGLKNVDDISKEPYFSMLNDDSKLFLECKPNQHIKHSKIEEIEKYLFASLPDEKITIAGSYRRKTPFSRDIDLLLVPKNAKSIDRVIDVLSEKDGKVYARGDDKVSLFCKFSRSYYKVDIFIVSEDDYVPYLLYATGSKVLNIRMRNLAKRKGYILNQKGLFKNGVKVKLKTEEDYFKILGMKYLTPEQRSLE